MTKTSKIILWILAIIIVIGLIWLGYQKEDGIIEDKENIKIGAVLSLTGIAQIHGENMKEGIDLAVDEINKKGGVNGRSIEIIYENDITDPKNSVSAVQKFINVDKVNAIIGPTWSFLAGAVMPTIDEGRVITLGPAILSGMLEDSSPYFFGMFPAASSKREAVNDFLDSLGGQNKRVAVMIGNGPFPIVHGDVYKEAIIEKNNILVDEIILPNPDNNDISTDLTKLNDLNIDAVLLSINMGDTANFLKKYREFGFDFKVFHNEDLVDVVNNVITDKSLAEDFCSLKVSDASDDFVERFREFYKKDPEIYSDTAYDSVYLISEAIKKYGMDDSEKTKQGLREIEYAGASGLISFDENNYISNKIYNLICFKDGKFIPYDEIVE